MDLQAGAPLRYRSAGGRWVLLATVLGSSLAFIDSTVVNIALPAISRDLGAGAAGLQWTVNGYALSLASLVLLGGSLSDRFGRKRVFLTGVAGFAVASLLCGLAPTIELLVAARVLQGIGGALLTPGALAILEASFTAGDRAALTWLARVGPDASYLTDVLPPVIVFGLGLALMVAPLTATALGSLDDAYAGVASGVNNAVARAAGLLSVAILPLAAGLGTGSLTDPVTLAPVYRTVMLLCAALMTGGGVLAWFLIPDRLTAHTPVRSFCDPGSPPVHPHHDVRRA